MEKNNQLAFDIAEKELGISPIMTGREMASGGGAGQAVHGDVPDPDSYEMFKDSLPSEVRVPRAAGWVPVALVPSDLLLCRCCRPSFGHTFWSAHLEMWSPMTFLSESCPFLSEPASLKSALL